MASDRHLASSAQPESGWRTALVFRFGSTSAAVGCALGLIEAALLATIPRVSGLEKRDVTYVIWFIAPLVDLVTFAFAGLLLSLPAITRKQPKGSWSAVAAAVGLGIAVAYLGFLLDWFRIGVGIIFPARLDLKTPAGYGILGIVISLLIFRLRRQRSMGFFEGQGSIHAQPLLLGLLLILAISAGGITYYARHRPYPPAPQAPARSGARATPQAPQFPVGGYSRPNIVLIVLDTARADHFSCYGYPRPTTPHIDRLAAKGQLFENAVAPTSWTLPSFISIFTGLLPHQHGASWLEPMGSGVVTLAQVLRSHRYQTAAFNANPEYGLAGWGLDQGFEAYEDDSLSIRHNLAATFAGQSLWRYLYRHIVGYNTFSHPNAGEVNRDVRRWWQRRSDQIRGDEHIAATATGRGLRSRRPFFLMINYMDVHRPYLPPVPYNHRFGRIPRSLLGVIADRPKRRRWRHAITHHERNELLAGYDNSLAFVDEEIGRLLELLRAQPDGRATIVIITSDHGEGFGEHGSYDHGWDLYWNVLHVPLIIEGDGIPAGGVIRPPVSIRQLFPTVITLALGEPPCGPERSVAQTPERRRPPCGGPSVVAQSSLSRFWLPSAARLSSQPVVSELIDWSPEPKPSASLSLVSDAWHFIIDSSGRSRLYDLRSDPGEEKSVAQTAAGGNAVVELRLSLTSEIAYSLLPWRGPSYLLPLDRPGGSFIELAIKERASFHPVPRPSGISQDYFSHDSPTQVIRPSPSQEDLLRSLPY